MKHLSTILATCLCLLVSTACQERDRYIAVTGYAQGGTYTVKMNLKGVRVAPDAIKSDIDSILTLIDSTLSGYNKASILSRFNAGETVTPNDLFVDIYDYCEGIWRATGGCVDVAGGPLFDIWGFGFKSGEMPDDAKVAQTLADCGMHRLLPRMEDAVRDGRLNPADLVKAGESGELPRLNYNAVAQGYSCDMVADYLRGLGVKDMLVDIGEIYCSGLNPSGKPWTIGVDRPVDGNDKPGEDLDGIWNSEGRSTGIVTSGNYRKFYIRDGRKYSHTIDMRSGYPVQHSLLSATIVAPTAAEADALATHCMVIGLDEAKAFIISRPDLEGYLIYEDGGEMAEWHSEGFALVTSQK